MLLPLRHVIVSMPRVEIEPNSNTLKQRLGGFTLPDGLLEQARTPAALARYIVAHCPAHGDCMTCPTRQNCEVHEHKHGGGHAHAHAHGHGHEEKEENEEKEEKEEEEEETDTPQQQPQQPQQPPHLTPQKQQKQQKEEIFPSRQQEGQSGRRRDVNNQNQRSGTTVGTVDMEDLSAVAGLCAHTRSAMNTDDEKCDKEE